VKVANTGALAVAGNTAVNTPEFAACVTLAAATVKEFAATPSKVNPLFADNVTVAL
jgi:hypothetical protein